MSRRWQPKKGEKYWMVNEIANAQEVVWRDDEFDRGFYEIGNCFNTAAEAVAAAEKVKALLLSLHEPTTECNQLPKLTTDVFNRPDCPEWAKYAVVDIQGLAYWYQYSPLADERIGVWKAWGNKRQLIDGFFDRSDWQNSIIKRPEEENALPEWCKVGEWVWLDGNYHKVIEVGEDRIRTEWNNNTGIWGANILYQFSQARLRPYNAEEMRGLVGKVVICAKGDASIVTDFDTSLNEVCIYGEWFKNKELLDSVWQLNGKPCGKLEHLDNGEWVE